MANVTMETSGSLGLVSDAFFPGTREFTVLEPTPTDFSITYAMDGLPGEGHTVVFHSTVPNSGTFERIDIYVDDNGDYTLLGRVSDFGSVALSEFDSPTLASFVLSDSDSFRGGNGNDTFRGYGSDNAYEGLGGNDTFIVGEGGGAPESPTLHGADNDGSGGGGGEINTVKLLGSVDLFTSQITDIEALTFDAATDATARILWAHDLKPGGLSNTLIVTGDSHTNTLEFLNDGQGEDIDLSGLQFQNWSAGTDVVSIEGSQFDETIVGTEVDDQINGCGGADVLVGKGGNDLFRIESFNGVPAAVHGSNADGTVGASETDLLDIQGGVDLRSITFTNIDGFKPTEGSFDELEFDSLTGAIDQTDQDDLITLNASQFGSGIATDALVEGDGNIVNFQVILNSPGSFNASGWQASDVDTSTDDINFDDNDFETNDLITASVLHIAGSSGNDVITGWLHSDVVVAGGGSDTVSTQAGNDQIFIDHNQTNSVINGGSGVDRVTIDWSAATAGVTLALSAPNTDTVDSAYNLITGIEAMTFYGTAQSDVLTGNDGDDVFFGNGGNDTLDGGAGTNKLYGGDGNDTIISSVANPDFGEFIGGEGTDTAILDRSGSTENFSINLLSADGTNVGDAWMESIERLKFVSGIGDDVIGGGNLNDDLQGGAGRDFLSGRGGNDVLSGGKGVDAIDGGDGDDVMEGGGAGDSIDGDDGIDTVQFATATSGVTVDRGNALAGEGHAYGDVFFDVEIFELTGFADQFIGMNDAETVRGLGAADRLMGKGGDDGLDGGNGNDMLVGGLGKDTLIGGLGKDCFDFNSITETPVGASCDIIQDFSRTELDKIDLASIDANTKVSGNQAFTFIGAKSFTKHAGELHYVKGADFVTVEGDVNGDAKADFAIQLEDLTKVVATDFWL